MKTNSTATVKHTNRWHGLRQWITATILLSLVSMANVLQAQVTNIIYQDNFGRTGNLDGSTPDTVNVPGANWFACDVPGLNAQIQTDGSEIALTNVTGTTNFFLNGFLPFVPQAGHIYYLSCNIKPLSGGTNWLALGFATHPLTNNFFSTYQCGSGWMGVRGNGLQINTWGSTSGTSTFTNAAGANFQTITVVLDTSVNTSSGAATALPQGNTQLGWQIRFYTNGVLVAGGNQTMQWGNYPVQYVGIGANQAQGYFQQFTLTDVRIRSGSPTIVEEPQNATAQEGQTATFWVGVTNDYPLSTYQWMTNSGGGPTNAIPGATNGFYTTPALDASYNGLNYSVAINNTLGSTSSVPAVLTVVSGPPTVYSAEKTLSVTNIVVAFSKAVDPVTGLNPANYSVTLNAGAPSGVSVLSASYGSGSNNVILMTSTLNTNTGYFLNVQNVQDLFGSAMSSAASVPVLPAGLVLYLRADSGVVLDANNNVVQWHDQTTNGNDVVQYFGLPTCGPNYLGPVARPTTMTGAFANNQPALEFGSTTHWLAAPSTPSLASMLSNTTMYAVARFTGASDEIVNKVWGNLPAPFDWDPNPNENIQYGNGVNNAPANGIGGVTSQNTPYVLASMLAFPPLSGFTTNIFNFWLNGVNNGTGGIRALTGNPPVFWDAGFPLWVGARWDLVNPRMRGEIAEIMLFNTPISGADRTNVDNYLGEKYFTFGIAQNLPPTTTSSNGFAVTYTFVASQGSVHGYGFQWQENGTNIPNATSSTYTTGILGPGDNGDTFDVIITLPDNSTTNSITNTLTVLNEPPYVTSAGITIWSPTNIVVFFDEAVDPVTATAATNYSLNNSATVLSAAMGDAPNKVVLTTSPLTFNANPGFYSLTVQNVKDLFNNTIVTASTPVGLYPNAALWVSADTGVTIDAGTNSVEQWNDLSGNGNNLITVSTQRPLLITNANGNLAIHFVSVISTNAFTNEMDALSSPSLAITGDMSIIAVMNFASLASGNTGDIVSKTGIGGDKNIPAPYDYYEGAGASLYRGNGGPLGNGISYGQVTATSAPTTNALHILVASDQGNTITHYIDGRNSGAGLLSNNYQEANNTDSNTDLTIGARADGVNRLTGDIYELFVTSSSMTASDVTALNSYLAAKYNVVLSNLSPTNIVLSTTGNNLLLSWPVDHTGWGLQSNSVGLTASNAWFSVAGSTTTNQVVITPNTTQTNVFFRMVYPPQ